MEGSGVPRGLKGHTATATSCIASRQRPGVVVTAAEDGCMCLFDLRCKDVQLVKKLGNDAISSLCFKEGS
ncbi:U5 small nuclear ribonucleoprotein 40 kDa protein, partial [Bienertia sinuspersici]